MLNEPLLIVAKKLNCGRGILKSLCLFHCKQLLLCYCISVALDTYFNYIMLIADHGETC